MVIALAFAAALLAPPPTESRQGLWIGDLRVCRENVERVQVSRDEAQGQAVLIAFREELRTLLHQETERRVGKPLRVQLDGRVIMEPVVLEPITGGTIQLSPGLDIDAEPFRRAAASQCGPASDILSN